MSADTKHSHDSSHLEPHAKKTKSAHENGVNDHKENGHHFDQHSRVDYAVIYTHDVKKSSEVFQTLFGFKPSGEYNSDKWMEFTAPGGGARGPKVGFILIGEDCEPTKRGSVQLTVAVKDIHRLHDELSKREGVKVESAPKKELYGTHAFYILPDGISLSVIEEPPVVRGGICHFDIPVEDMQRATKFYSDVFGWKTKKFTDEYALYETGDLSHPLAGGFTVTKERINFPGTHIHVEDVDKHLEKIIAAGGKLHKEKVVIPGGHGAYVQFQDTEGNLMAVYSR